MYIFSHASAIGSRDGNVGQSVLCPDLYNSTAIGWIAIRICTDIPDSLKNLTCLLTYFADPLTLHIRSKFQFVLYFYSLRLTYCVIRKLCVQAYMCICLCVFERDTENDTSDWNWTDSGTVEMEDRSYRCSDVTLRIKIGVLAPEF